MPDDKKPDAPNDQPSSPAETPTPVRALADSANDPAAEAQARSEQSRRSEAAAEPHLPGLVLDGAGGSGAGDRTQDLAAAELARQERSSFQFMSKNFNREGRDCERITADGTSIPGKIIDVKASVRISAKSPDTPFASGAETVAKPGDFVLREGTNGNYTYKVVTADQINATSGDRIKADFKVGEIIRYDGKVGRVLDTATSDGRRLITSADDTYEIRQLGAEEDAKIRAEAKEVQLSSGKSVVEDNAGKLYIPAGTNGELVEMVGFNLESESKLLNRNLNSDSMGWATLDGRLGITQNFTDEKTGRKLIKFSIHDEFEEKPIPQGEVAGLKLQTVVRGLAPLRGERTDSGGNVYLVDEPKVAGGQPTNVRQATNFGWAEPGKLGPSPVDLVEPYNAMIAREKAAGYGRSNTRPNATVGGASADKPAAANEQPAPREGAAGGRSNTDGGNGAGNRREAGVPLGARDAREAGEETRARPAAPIEPSLTAQPLDRPIRLGDSVPVEGVNRPIIHITTDAKGQEKAIVLTSSRNKVIENMNDQVIRPDELDRQGRLNKTVFERLPGDHGQEYRGDTFYNRQNGQFYGFTFNQEGQATSKTQLRNLRAMNQFDIDTAREKAKPTFERKDGLVKEDSKSIRLGQVIPDADGSTTKVLRLSGSTGEALVELSNVPEIRDSKKSLRAQDVNPAERDLVDGKLNPEKYDRVSYRLPADQQAPNEELFRDRRPGQERSVYKISFDKDGRPVERERRPELAIQRTEALGQQVDNQLRRSREAAVRALRVEKPLEEREAMGNEDVMRGYVRRMNKVVTELKSDADRAATGRGTFDAEAAGKRLQTTLRNHLRQAEADKPVLEQLEFGFHNGPAGNPIETFHHAKPGQPLQTAHFDHGLDQFVDTRTGRPLRDGDRVVKHVSYSINDLRENPAQVMHEAYMAALQVQRKDFEDEPKDNVTMGNNMSVRKDLAELSARVIKEETGARVIDDSMLLHGDNEIREAWAKRRGLKIDGADQAPADEAGARVERGLAGRDNARRPARDVAEDANNRRVSPTEVRAFRAQVDAEHRAAQADLLLHPRDRAAHDRATVAKGLYEALRDSKRERSAREFIVEQTKGNGRKVAYGAGALAIGSIGLAAYLAWKAQNAETPVAPEAPVGGIR